MRRIYENSPIVEAVCEFKFEAEGEWDLTIPGLVYERIQNRFPKRLARTEPPAQLTALLGADFAEQLRQSMPLARFASEDGTGLIQIGHNVLGISHLRPYTSWERFRSMIKDGLDTYRNVTGSSQLQHLGLRYINHIDIPQTAIDIQEYLNTYPVIPLLTENQMMIHWLHSVEIPFEDIKGVLRLHVASVEAERPDGLSLLLDLDLHTRSIIPKIDDVFSWLTKAHDHIETMFESSITDTARALFKEQVKS